MISNPVRATSREDSAERKGAIFEHLGIDLD